MKAKQETIGFNITLVGPENTGKSKFAQRFAYPNMPFDDHYESTVGAYFATKTVPLIKKNEYTQNSATASSNDKNNPNIKFQIWDTAGQEKYKSMLAMYCKSTQAIIFFVDVTKSIKNNQIKEYLEAGKVPENTPILFVISKSDNKNQYVYTKPLDQDQLRTYLNENGLKYHAIHTISAKTTDGIDELEQSLLSIAKENIALHEQENTSNVVPKKPMNVWLQKQWQNIQQTISKHLDVLVAILVGVVLGVALSATGVLAPLWGAILGIVFLGVIAGTVLGLTIALFKSIDNYIRKVDLPNNSINKTLEAFKQLLSSPAKDYSKDNTVLNQGQPVPAPFITNEETSLSQNPSSMFNVKKHALATTIQTDEKPVSTLASSR